MDDRTYTFRPKRPFIPRLFGSTKIRAYVFLSPPPTATPTARVDKNKKAKKSLQWLRGKNADVTQEFGEIEKANHVGKNEEMPGYLSLFSKMYSKPLLISMGLMLFQQLSGINAIIFYTVKIFKVCIYNISYSPFVRDVQMFTRLFYRSYAARHSPPTIRLYAIGSGKYHRRERMHSYRGHRELLVDVHSHRSNRQTRPQNSLVRFLFVHGGHAHHPRHVLQLQEQWLRRHPIRMVAVGQFRRVHRRFRHRFRAHPLANDGRNFAR